MRLNLRQRLADLWSGSEAVPYSVGQSLSRAIGRLQAISLFVLIFVVLLQAVLLWFADRHLDAADQAALIAAEQPALVLRLGAAAGNAQPDEDFAAILAVLRANHHRLTSVPNPADAPARASSALAAVYGGAGYTLDARMQDLFALAQRVHDAPPPQAARTGTPPQAASTGTPPQAASTGTPPQAASTGTPQAASTDTPPAGDAPPADAAKEIAAPAADAALQAGELRRNAEGPMQDRLQQAAQLHAALARARLGTLRWLQALTSITLSFLLVILAVSFRRLEVRVVRVIGMLEGLAGRDPLTGVLSRNAFTAKLRRMLLEATKERGVGLVLFDLDQFRGLTAIEGGAAGDSVLRAVARRLRNAAGLGATVVRLTADSFAVALPGLAGGHAALASAAQRLSATMAEPIPFEGRLLRVRATAGTALAPLDTTDRGELIHMAEIAVREAKQEMPGGTRPFRDPDEAAQKRRETLLRAIAEQQFDGVTAWLQPVVRCADRRVVGFEALARWEHPVLGRVSPSEFIPMADAGGRLPLLSAVVRKAAFRTLAACHAAGLTAPRLSLNLAPAEFARPATMSELEASLAAAGLTPAALEIEVSEDALLADPDHDAMRALEDLRTRGARLVLDDFGVGFSSLVHLQRFTVDALKMDRSFIAGIGVDPRAEAILRAIFGLAQALGITTIAKGVESDEQAAFLKSHGCDEMQGYLVAAPMAPDDVENWLRANQRS